MDKSKIETGRLLDVAVEFADLKNTTGRSLMVAGAKIINDVYTL